MDKYTPYQFGQVLAGFCHAVRIEAPAYVADSGVINRLDLILKETRIMSEAQTQQGRDIAQIAADLATIKPAFQTMVDKIAALNAASAAGAGSVSPELQAQIDDLHAFAQSVAPAPAAPVADPAPVVTDPATATPAPEPTSAAPSADTTPEPAPVTTAPADPSTPQA